MGVLQLITPLLGVAGLLGLILSVASALLRVCEWIEDNPAKSRLIGARIGQGVAVLVVTTTAFDGLPWLYMACSLAAASCLCWGSTHHRKRPDAKVQESGSLSLLLKAAFIGIASLASHLALVHCFHASMQRNQQAARRGDVSLNDIHPDDRSRPRLPGGRIDWDTYDDSKVAASVTAMATAPVQVYTSAQQLTALVICWLPALWIVLCAIAKSSSLPISTANTQSFHLDRRPHALTSWSSHRRMR